MKVQLAQLEKYEDFTPTHDVWIPMTLRCVCGDVERLAVTVREKVYTCPKCRRQYWVQAVMQVRTDVSSE